MPNVGINDLTKTPLDVSKAKAYNGLYAKQILRRLFQELEIAKHFAIDFDVKSSKNYPKIVTKAKIRPYDGKVDSDGSSITLSDRQLTVSVGQTELVIDPEIFRNTWAVETSDPSKGKVALEGYILEDFMNSILESINNGLILLGDKSSTNKEIKLIDGLDKLVEALITAGDITPIVTAAHTETLGTFGAITQSGNVISNVKKVWKSFTVPQRKQVIYIDCSYDVYEMYVNSYRVQFGHECAYSKTAIEGDQLVIDGTGGKGILRRSSYLGTSSRLVAYLNGAIRLGTDLDTFAGSVDIQKLGYQWLYMVKIVLGLQIIDLEAVRFNNLR